MTREGKLQKKQPPEAEKYHIARREPYASRKNKSGGRRERECSPDGEWLPPPPPLDGNVKPTKYHGAIPSLPQPPRRSRSGCSTSATTVAPTSPKPVSPLRETDQVVHTSDAGAPLAKHDGGSENDDDHDVSGMDCSFIHDLLSDEAMAALDAEYDLDSLYTTMQVLPSGKASATPALSADHGKNDLNDDEDIKFFCPRAKKIKAMLDDSLQMLVHKGPQFPTTLLPTSIVQEQQSLNLPLDDLVARMHVGCVYLGLKEIQALLRQKPLKKDAIIEAIEVSTSEWATRYKESTPDGVKKLVSLFQALAMRLEEKTPPSIFGDEIATLAEKEARPLLKKLDMAVTSATSEVQLLRGEVPGLEEEMSKMKDLELEHEKKAKELEREAADARKLAKGLRNQQRTMANKLQCIKIASNTFDAHTKQLKQRADEVIDFLQLFETEEKKLKPRNPRGSSHSGLCLQLSRFSVMCS
ncbi:unnamed protein product [Alopecurus aequalis]